MPKLPGLVDSVFLSGPDDKLASVDAYAKQSDKLINSVYNGFKSGDLSQFSLDKLSSMLGVAESAIPGLIRVISRLDKASGLDLLKRMLFEANPKLKGFLQFFSNTSKQLKSLLSRLNAFKSTLNLAINGFKARFKKKDPVKISAIINQTSAFLGGNYTTSYTTTPVKIFEATTVTYNLSDKTAYVPGAFTALAQDIDDRRILLHVVDNALLNIVANKNIDLLSEIVAIIGGPEVLKLYPNFVKDFLKDLKNDPGKIQLTYASQYEVYRQVFQAIDPSFNSPMSSSFQALSCEAIAHTRCVFFHDLIEAWCLANTKQFIIPSSGMWNLDYAVPVYDENERFYNLVKNWINDEQPESIFKPLRDAIPGLVIQENPVIQVR